MFKTILLVVVFISTVASANSRSYYSLLDVTNISNGIIDKNGNAHFTIEYVIHGCAQGFVKFLLTDAQAPNAAVTTGNTKYQTVGVLAKNYGFMCYGPTAKKIQNVVVPAPLPMGGASLYSIQHSDIINYALSSPEAKPEFVNRVPSDIKTAVTGNFNKVYTIEVETVENGIGPNGPSTHPCSTTIVVNVFSGVAGPSRQVASVHTACAMNSPIVK